jgi:hypothetical protein
VGGGGVSPDSVKASNCLTLLSDNEVVWQIFDHSDPTLFPINCY